MWRAALAILIGLAIFIIGLGSYAITEPRRPIKDDVADNVVAIGAIVGGLVVLSWGILKVRAHFK